MNAQPRIAEKLREIITLAPAGSAGLRRFAIALFPFILVGVLCFARLGHRELYSSHEARAAQNAQMMIDTGDWGLPTLFDGRIDLQKPPGYYWATATFGLLYGGHVTEWVARFPAAMSGFLSALSVYVFLRLAGRPRAAVIAMLVLATANHYMGISRIARIDVPLTLAVTVSLLAFYQGCTCPPTPGRAAWRTLAWHLAAALAASAAMLLKGPVGPAIIAPTAFLWLFAERIFSDSAQRPRVPMLSWLLIPAVAAAVGLPWFFWANHTTNGEFMRVFFWHHTIDRYTGNSPALASHPWWYYVPRFLVDFMPWTPVLNLLTGWSLRTGQWRADPIFRFALVAFLTVFTVLSTAHFKRADYLLPAFPFAAIMVGCAADSWLASRTRPASVRIANWLFGILVGVGIACWLIMLCVLEPAEQKKEEKRRFAAMIRTYAPVPQMILQYRMESHLLSYHLGRPLYTFVEWSELNEILAQPGPHFVVMSAEYVYPAENIIKSRKLVPIARLEDYTHGKPLRPLVFLRTAD